MVPLTVECRLCPKHCRIAEGEAGDCRIRMNLGGMLRAVTYGMAVATHIDPVEKKPFFHYHPGEQILSIATAGCNLHCQGCQNWQISQANPEDLEAVALPPEGLVSLAVRERVPLIACTYTEPLAYYEYTLDTARAGRERGIPTAIVSAGYANDEPVRALFREIDAATIDVKAFDDAYYRQYCDGGLRPVLNTLVAAREAGIWLEVSNLVVPGMTDDAGRLRELSAWIHRELGPDTPLHFLRFVPHYRMQNLPPTPVATLERAWDIAREAGLRYVYLGNVRGHPSESTHCASCGETVISRAGYQVLEVRLDEGRCPRCGTEIPGRFGRIR